MVYPSNHYPEFPADGRDDIVWSPTINNIVERKTLEGRVPSREVEEKLGKHGSLLSNYYTTINSLSMRGEYVNTRARMPANREIRKSEISMPDLFQGLCQ